MGLVVLALLGVSWYYSDQIIKPTPRLPLETGLGVVALGDSSITLSGSEQARNGRRWFLEWPGGYGVTGDVIASEPTRITRAFHPLVGRPQVGGAVDLAAFPYGGDPQHYAGLAFEEVAIQTPLGATPAWFVPGSRDTWVVFVHGMTAGRGEALRVMPAIARLGYPMLAITYRNSPGAPRSKDKVYHLGASEWEDLQAAVRYAREHGARHLVLFGYSMGGTIVADFLDRSSEDRDVVGVILDAPVLDWNAAVQLAANRRHVPGVLTTVAEGIVSMRIGFDWNGPPGKVRVGEFGVPVLLFHGTADATVPIAPSEALAAAGGGKVTFVRTPEAGHVRSWNFDPEGYERALATWLASLRDSL